MDDCLPGFIQPLHFSVADGHHYVDVRSAELSDSQEASSLDFQQGILAERETADWLHRKVLYLAIFQALYKTN